MLLIDAFVLAADPGRGGQDPGSGLGLGLIAAVVVAVIVLAALGFMILHRLTRASKGGVQPRAGEFERGAPPLESLSRRRSRR
jgi:hypothetical protein